MRLDSLDEDDARAAMEGLDGPGYSIEVVRWPRARTLDPFTETTPPSSDLGDHAAGAVDICRVDGLLFRCLHRN